MCWRLGLQQRCLLVLVFLVLRDPYGIRPLVMGKRPSGSLVGATDYMMASESVALRQLGFTDIVDILPDKLLLFGRVALPYSGRSFLNLHTRPTFLNTCTLPAQILLLMASAFIKVGRTWATSSQIPSLRF